jgi:hypothetical protein
MYLINKALEICHSLLRSSTFHDEEISQSTVNMAHLPALSSTSVKIVYAEYSSSKFAWTVEDGETG